MFAARLALVPGLLLLSMRAAAAGQDLPVKFDGLPPHASAPAEVKEGGMRFEPMPYTHWLDFNQLAVHRWAPDDLPEWLAPVTTMTTHDDRGMVHTIFRLHFRGFAHAGREVQCRVFFDDHKEIAPTISARASNGSCLLTRGPLGAGLGLPASETVTFPGEGVDWVEIRVAGDGLGVRGVFLAILASQPVHHAADFAAPPNVIDAFGNHPPMVPSPNDQALFGRVRAMLDEGAVRLEPASAIRGAWEFPLESPPLLAVVTFEVLHADSLAPLELILNGRPLGPVGVHWPDLADPGYLGLARPLERDMRFRYTGWLRGQKVIPGSALRAGANELILQLHPDSGALAVRAVELSLKYPWKRLDYTLAPSHP